MSAAAAAAEADRLKAEAERLLHIDSARSLEIAEEICRLEPDGSVRALGLMARANELLEAELLTNLSVAYYQVDEFARAGAFLERAVAIFEREGQHEDVARAHRNFARFAAASGHYSKALAAVGPGRRALLSMGRIDGAAHLGQVGVDCLVRLNRSAEAVE